MQVQNITGQRFGRWTVLQFHDSIKYNYLTSSSTVTRWLCRCDCGNEKVVRGQSLKNGRSVSCRCYQREFQRARQTKHGQVNSPEYTAWAHMVDRCDNPKNPAYKNYGGRGITVCERWRTAANFLADIGPRPTERHSLERINNDFGYSPSNCRWATPKEQCNNKRTNRRLRFDGRVQTVAQWSRELGIGTSNIWNRLIDGWSTQETLSTPVSEDKRGWETRRKRKSAQALT